MVIEKAYMRPTKVPINIAPKVLSRDGIFCNGSKNIVALPAGDGVILEERSYWRRAGPYKISRTWSIYTTYPPVCMGRTRFSLEGKASMMKAEIHNGDRFIPSPGQGKGTGPRRHQPWKHAPQV